MTAFHIVPRGAGKTSLLLEKLKSDPKTALVVSSYAQAAALAKAHPELATRIITLRELTHNTHYYKQARVRLLIDEVDTVLSSLLAGMEIDTVTGTDTKIAPQSLASMMQDPRYFGYSDESIITIWQDQRRVGAAS